MELGWCLWMQGSGAAPGTIRPLVRSFGCAGFFVWLAIGAIFATFFIGEYLDRPETQKSFWKAGVTVSCFKTAKKQYVLFRGSGALDLFLEPEQESPLFYSWSSTQSGKSGNETKTSHSRCFHHFCKFSNQYISDQIISVSVWELFLHMTLIKFMYLIIQVILKLSIVNSNWNLFCDSAPFIS